MRTESVSNLPAARGVKLQAQQAMGKRGGSGRGQGRKPLSPTGELTRARSVTLPETDWAFLELVGDGNASRGVRQLIAQIRELQAQTLT